jgi:ankyrin repeat protein
LAALYGHIEVVELLIKAGADISIQNIYGQTALDVARNKRRENIAALILQTQKDQLAREQRAQYTQELLQKTPLAAELASEIAGYLAAPIKEQRESLDAYAQTILKQIGDALEMERAKDATSQATNTLLEMHEAVTQDRELINQQITEERLIPIQDRLTQNYQKLLEIRSKQ